MDALTEILQDLRLSGSSYCRTELRSPWGLEIPARDSASFHFVVNGFAWLRLLAGGEPIRLDEGDLVLLPHGRGHFLGDAPHSPAVRIDTLRHRKIGQSGSLLRHGGSGPKAMIICGGVKFEDPVYHPLLELIPEMLLIRGHGGQSEKWVQNTLEMMTLEATTPRPGTPTVITHLADILVIQAVRDWLERSPATDAGWISAVRDPQVGRAIALIHRRPERPWSVASLAAEAHLSRSVFSERFTRLVGMSPMRYVTRWRMRLADTLIREQRLALSEVAGRVGYGSEAAFSRAYKREAGVSPGATRRHRVG
jgi:AraC-like DNA-binding protein